MGNLYNYIVNKDTTPKKKIFVVVKPGFLDKTSDILNIYNEEGWKLEFSTIKRLLLEEAKKLYICHKKKDFYDQLCEYMCSGVTRAFIFSNRTNNDEFEEASLIKDKIRKKWGESDMRNVVHSSDSKENLWNEAGIYFGDCILI